MDLLDPGGQFQSLHIIVDQLCSKILRLFLHDIRQVPAGNILDPGIVHDFCRKGNLPAKFIILNHKNLFFGTGGINRSSQPCRTTPDDNHII